MRYLLICLMGAGLLACGDSDGGADDAGPGEHPFRDRTWLINPELFEVVDAADDPFEDRPSEPFDCAVNGYLAEDFGGELVYSVYTDRCAYVTAVQPSLEDVYEGEYLKVRLWHFKLTAPEPAEAHVVVGMGGPDEGLDKHIAIPTEMGSLISESWQAPRDYPAGTPIYFHAHNHGDNEYALIELTTGTDDPNADK